MIETSLRLSQVNMHLSTQVHVLPRSRDDTWSWRYSYIALNHFDCLTHNLWNLGTWPCMGERQHNLGREEEEEAVSQFLHFCSLISLSIASLSSLLTLHQLNSHSSLIPRISFNLYSTTLGQSVSKSFCCVTESCHWVLVNSAKNCTRDTQA